MSAELVEYQSPNDDSSWTPEARAIEEILLAEQGGEIFSQSRTRWLGRLLGVRPDDSGPVTERQFETMNNQAYTLAIIDALPGLREAAQVKGAYPEAQKLGIGLWLIGWGDDKIAGLFGKTKTAEKFGKTKTAVSTERKKLADAIAGGRNHLQTIDTKEDVYAARKTAAAAVLGSVAVSSHIKSTLPDELKLYQPQELELINVYPAAELLEDIETRFISSRKLLPEHRGLLKRHFLGIGHEMIAEERNAIGPALRSLRSVLREKVKKTQLNPSRPKLYKSVQLLLTLVDDDYRIPPSSAMHVNAADYDKRLDLALSWLLTRKSPPPEPSRSKKARIKPVADAEASETS